MSTVVMSKKRFMDWVGRQIPNKGIVLLSMDKSGSISYVKKRSAKTVQFDFAADSFACKEDVRDLCFKVPTLAIAVCDKEDVSKETFGMVAEGDKKYLPQKSNKKQ